MKYNITQIQTTSLFWWRVY